MQMLGRVQLFVTPMECGLPGSSVHGVPRREYWGELPCPPLEDLPDPRIEPMPLVSLSLAADSLPVSLLGKPIVS